MSDRLLTIIGTIFSAFGFGFELYSIIENKGIAFNARTLLFVSLIVIGIVLIVVFGTRNKRRKEKEFSNRIFKVRVAYDNDYAYLTISNITGNQIKNISVEIPKNRTSYSKNDYPYLIDTTSFQLNGFTSRSKEININGYRKRFDVSIKWGNNIEDTFLLKQI